MHDHTTDVRTPDPRVEEARYAPRHPGGIFLEDVAALVEGASGADAAAIEGLETIAVNLRRPGRPRPVGRPGAARDAAPGPVRPGQDGVVRGGAVMTTTDAMRTEPTVHPPRAEAGMSEPAHAAGVTVHELEAAWEAVRAGRFRDRRPASDAQALRSGTTLAAGRVEESATGELTGPVVTVVGAHGWSGASTTALLIAETAARGGEQVRLVDAADPVRSGLVGAAATEHGHDETGNWRRGSRGAGGGLGQLRLERLDRRAVDPLAIPASAACGPTGLTVVDSGWPLHDLLQLVQDPAGQRHWLVRLIQSPAVVLTARASVPGVQQLAGALTALESVRGSGQSPVVALVGAHRLSRLLQEVVTGSIPAATAEDRVVLLPARRDLAMHGVTSFDLPSQLTAAGIRLLRLTGHCTTEASGTAARRRRRGGW